VTHLETDEDSAYLRTQVSAVALSPTRLTANDLLADGRRARRRRRRRSVAASGGALVLTAGVVVGIGAYLPDRGGAATAPPASAAAPATNPSPTVAPGPCTVAPLALPRGAVDGAVNTGSPNGRYLAGYATTSTDPGMPVWWDGNKVQRIPVSGTGEAKGVNDSGVVVGGTGGVAWAYANGRLTELPVPKGYTSAEANAINARGQVTGVAFAGDRVAAVIWHGTSSNSAVEVLTAPKGGAMGFGISDSGIVVGRLNSGGLFSWDAQGRGSRLALPAGTTGGHVAGVRGELAYGAAKVAGGGDAPDLRQPDGVYVADVDQVGVVWDLRTGTAAAAGDGMVNAVNGRGHLVLNRPDNTVVLREPDGSQRELPSDGSPSIHGYTVSEDGTRVAGARTTGPHPAGGSLSAPVRWSCPASGR
jgi:hypothetical protein